VQGSKEWLAWRQGGLGSSDVSVLMGENKHETIKDLWLRKTGRLEARAENAAMRHGKEHEQAAREALCEYTGDFWRPVCLQDDIWEWMRVSLDGWNGSMPAEIKCPTTERKWMEMCAAVPLYYRAQLQYQIAVSEADRAYFWAWFEGKGNLIVVERDDDYIVEMLKRADQMWACIELETYPDFFKENEDGRI
jgi:putative phage-type endonuclease